MKSWLIIIIIIITITNDDNYISYSYNSKLTGILMFKRSSRQKLKAARFKLHKKINIHELNFF